MGDPEKSTYENERNKQVKPKIKLGEIIADKVTGLTGDVIGGFAALGDAAQRAARVILDLQIVPDVAEAEPGDPVGSMPKSRHP